MSDILHIPDFESVLSENIIDSSGNESLTNLKDNTSESLGSHDTIESIPKKSKKSKNKKMAKQEIESIEQLMTHEEDDGESLMEDDFTVESYGSSESGSEGSSDDGSSESGSEGSSDDGSSESGSEGSSESGSSSEEESDEESSDFEYASVDIDDMDSDDDSENELDEISEIDEDEEHIYPEEEEDDDLGGEDVATASLVAASLVSGMTIGKTKTGMSWTHLMFNVVAIGGLGIALYFAWSRIRELTKNLKELEESNHMAMTERDVQVITTQVIDEMLKESDSEDEVIETIVEEEKLETIVESEEESIPDLVKSESVESFVDIDSPQMQENLNDSPVHVQKPYEFKSEINMAQDLIREPSKIVEKIVEEPVHVEEPKIVEEPVHVEEPKIIEEPVHVEEPNITEEPVIIEKVIEEIVKKVEIIDVEEEFLTIPKKEVVVKIEKTDELQDLMGAMSQMSINDKPVRAKRAVRKK